MKIRTGFRVAVVVILVALFGWIYYLFSGSYNVAADEDHWAVTSWMLETIREQSIEARLGEIDVPELEGEERIRSGAEHYDAMCAGCHLKPGQKNSEIRQGLNPTSPNLTRHADDPAEAFWVVKHGIRMTGMPAWGATHSDRDIWNIVAFLQKLPELTPEEYEALLPAGEEADDGHAHEHGETAADESDEPDAQDEPASDDGQDHEH